MNPRERIKRIREVESTVARLAKKGWAVESVIHVDEEGEPFRTTVELRVNGTSAVGDGPL